MAQTLRPTRFKEINLGDPFFDSLKAQYEEFSDWFLKKSLEPAYVIDDPSSGGIRGFLYLKIEEGEIADVSPSLPPKRRLKVGTLKVKARGTKLGERIVKRIFDHAFLENVKEVYVTVFDTHESLIALFMKYGFKKIGTKTTINGTELVLLRSFELVDGDLIKDYPMVHVRGRDKWLLAIHPEYHTKLLPDSILRTEDPGLEQDVPHTNSIHKIYIAGLPLTRMKRGDIVVFYRTTDVNGRAYYRSVATSVCVIEDTYTKKNFASEDDFVNFCRDHSVFGEQELRDRFKESRRLFVAKLTYNVSFARRPNRAKLLEDVGISEFPYWQLRKLDDKQFARILELGGVDEGIIVD